MHAEVISIGDELTGGQRLDTNTQWLSRRLEDLGIRVVFHSCVGDDLGAMVAVLRSATQRADVVVVTGGLGPTADDLTRHALAQLSEQPLELHADVLHQIRQLFQNRGRRMPERNKIQAQFPTGSTVIPNPHGTAPGIQLSIKNARDNESAVVFALPGVPAEMQQMWSEFVKPRLLARLGSHRRFVRHRLIRCFGAGESRIEEMLPDLVRRGRQPRVGITASRATITLRITAESDSEQACRELMEPVAKTIYDCLGSLVFGEGDDQLQDVVVEQLISRRMTLAVAEWGTDGLVNHWLSLPSRAGDAIRGGLVVRRESDLAPWLDPFPESVSCNAEDAVISPQVARMAVVVRDVFHADCGLAIGPFPPADCLDRPDARLELACVGPTGLRPLRTRAASHPAIRVERCAKVALNLVRKTLLELPGPGDSIRGGD